MDEHHEHHDQTAATYSAGCDACAHIARVHAPDDETAVNALAQDLAAHNKAAHGEETDPEAIKEPIRAKMKKLDFR